MKKKELEELFVSIAEQNDTAEEMIKDLRNLESYGDITEKEYNYLLKEWDRLLGKYDLL